MTADVVTLMQFESGEMSEREIVEMLSEILKTGDLDNHDAKFGKLARKYIRSEVLDEDGDINYQKLKE